jgi:hypothetical protein
MPTTYVTDLLDMQLIQSEANFFELAMHRFIGLSLDMQVISNKRLTLMIQRVVFMTDSRVYTVYI